MRRVTALVLGLLALSGCEESDRPQAAREQWKVHLAPVADQPNLDEASASVWIPAGLDEVQGALVFSRHALGIEMYEDARWRQAAADDGYALIEIEILADDDTVAAFAFPDQAATMIEDLLDAAAIQTGHGELHDAPVVVWGHSAGAQMMTPAAALMPGRVAGFIAFHGSAQNQHLRPSDPLFDALMDPAFLDVPGLVMVAEHDPTGLRDASVRLIEEGQERGCRWALTIDPDQDHWGTEGTFDLMIPFVRLAFEGSTAAGWLGTMDHFHQATGDETGSEIVTHTAIEPLQPGVLPAGNWLANQDFAASWLAYHQPTRGGIARKDQE